MAVTHGSVGVFDSAEEWETYIELVEIYLAANKISDPAQKMDVLFSVCGASVQTAPEGSGLEVEGSAGRSVQGSKRAYSSPKIHWSTTTRTESYFSPATLRHTGNGRWC